MVPQEVVVGSVVERWTTMTKGEEESSPRVVFTGLVVDWPLTTGSRGNFVAGSKLVQVPAWIEAGWGPVAFWRAIVTVRTTLGDSLRRAEPLLPPLTGCMT